MTSIGNIFSDDLKQLIVKSRQIAFETGHDYISTVHFFLADCEIQSPTSLLKFAFEEDGEAYRNFKKDYTIEPKYDLDIETDDLPLTVEAEQALKTAETERINYKQDKIFPCHLLIASFKVKDSIIADSFEPLLNELISFYSKNGAFEHDQTKY